MLRFLKSVNRRAVHAEKFVAGSLVLAVFLLVLLQVVMRYVFAHPNPWTEELSRFGFIWLSMLGAALAVELRTHFVFDQLVGKLTPKFQTIVRVCSTAFAAAMAFALIVLGLELVLLVGSQRSSALNIPISWIYASVPVAGLLMLLHITASLDSVLSGGTEGQS